MKHKLLVLIFLIFPMVSATSLSVSPPHLYFDLSEDQEKCEEILIATDSESVIIGEDRWALKDYSKILSDYKLTSKEVGVKLKYVSEKEISKQEALKICFLAKKKGIYSGIILYRAQGTSAGVGTWITANVSAEKPNFLTGRIVSKNISLEWSLLTFQIIFLLVLLGILIFLNQKLKRPRKDSNLRLSP